MGGKGEGFSGTTIKDTWTKPKEVVWRVGGADGWYDGVKLETTVHRQQ